MNLLDICIDLYHLLLEMLLVCFEFTLAFNRMVFKLVLEPIFELIQLLLDQVSHIFSELFLEIYTIQVAIHLQFIVIFFRVHWLLLIHLLDHHISLPFLLFFRLWSQLHTGWQNFVMPLVILFHWHFHLVRPGSCHDIGSSGRGWMFKVSRSGVYREIRRHYLGGLVVERGSFLERDIVL